MLKRVLEHYLFLSRWLLAPFFVMLTLGLFALMIYAGRQLLSIGSARPYRSHPHRRSGHAGVDIGLRKLRRGRAGHAARGLSPMDGGIDFSQLKLKLLSTIVAISAIKLLEAFMDVPKIEDRELNYYIAIHIVFVISTLMFAYSDRVSASTQVEKKTAEEPKDEVSA